MDATKTRIYREGLAGLTGATPQSNTDPAHASPPSSRDSEPPPNADRQRLLQRHNALRMLQSMSELHSTRVMPIERLLAHLPTAPPPAAAPPIEPAPSQGTRPTSSLSPVSEPALLSPPPQSTAAVRPSRDAQLPAARAGAARLSRPELPPALAAAMRAARRPVPQPAKRTRRPLPRFTQIAILTAIALLTWGVTTLCMRELGRTESPGASSLAPVAETTRVERAAVDALNAGDLARARRLYRELARSNAQNPVYAEIARILDANDAASRGAP